MQSQNLKQRNEFLIQQLKEQLQSNSQQSEILNNSQAEIKTQQDQIQQQSIQQLQDQVQKLGEFIAYQ